MANRLKNLKAVEVSIVPKGANKQQFLVVKEDVGMTDLLKVIKDAGEIGKLSDKVVKDLEPVLKALSDKGQGAVQAALKILGAVKDEIPDDLMKQIMALAGMGNPPAPPAPVVAAPAAKDMVDPMVPVQKEDGSWDFSKIPETVRATIQSIWKEKTETAASLSKIQKQLDEERDQRVVKEFQEKASVFKALGVPAAELAKVMKEVSEKAPESYKTLEPMLKSLDEKILKSGLFTEIGTTTPGAAAPVNGQTEAEAKIEAIAKGYVEKSEKKMTREAAIAKAWSENKDLYTAHREEIAARK